MKMWMVGMDGESFGVDGEGGVGSGKNTGETDGGAGYRRRAGYRRGAG